jgi:CubicO group peptidase (beta-lactamase class C family)
MRSVLTSGILLATSVLFAESKNPALDNVRALMRDAIERREIPGGSLLMIHNGEVILREGFGYADLETRRPFPTDDACFIASLTKPITATLAVMLDAQGVFSLDDPVEKWLPEFKGISVKGHAGPATPPIIWQLLSHRSGLPGNDDPGAVRGRTAAKPATLADIVAGWAQAGLLAEPGTRFAYGNAGYNTLAHVIEVATHRKYDALMQERIFDPLGMGRTTFRPSAQVLQSAPHRYRRTKTGLEADDGVYPVPPADQWVNAAGGLFSTLDDLGRFARMHLDGGKAGGKQIVAADKLARMYRSHPQTPGSGYGLGFNTGDGRSVRHIGGSGTFLWIDFENNAATIMFTQVPWEGNTQLMTRVMTKVKEFYSAKAAN